MPLNRFSIPSAIVGAVMVWASFHFGFDLAPVLWVLAGVALLIVAFRYYRYWQQGKKE